MRRRRAIIFDDDVLVLAMLRDFFILRGYEVLTYQEPVECPMNGPTPGDCQRQHPCADVMITDFNMPRMNGIDLLRHQAARGCRLDARNKAILSGYMGPEHQQILEEMGCAFFRKPFPFLEFSQWVDACEERSDLSRPLASRRKEHRVDSNEEVLYRMDQRGAVLQGIALNMSKSGLCLRSIAALDPSQTVHIDSDLPNACRTASVRWVVRTVGGPYVAGLICD